MTRMEIPLELTAPMMRDFTPPSAMPFHGEPTFNSKECQQIIGIFPKHS
jgi:hypothetical protein